MIPRLTARVIAAFLIALFIASCTAMPPMTRSYDDPYNAPTPDEVAPPNMRSDEEACARSNSCRGLCKRDKDCEDGEICYQARCVSRDISLGEEPAPTLEPVETSPAPE